MGRRSPLRLFVAQAAHRSAEGAASTPGRAKQIPVAKIPKQNLYTAYVKAMYHRAGGDSLAEKIKNIGASWRNLSPQEKAEWASCTHPDTQGSAAVPQRIEHAPALKVPKPNAYSAYVKANYHRVEGDGRPQKIRNIGALWRALSPQEKGEWASEARPDVGTRPASAVSKKNRPNAISLYMKAMMADAPKGTPQCKLRYIGAQWTALPSEEKAVWNRKAAELLSESPQKAPRALQPKAEGVGLVSPKTKQILMAKAPHQNPYTAYVKATYHQTEGENMIERTKQIGALWRTLSPEDKAAWALRVRSHASISNIPKVVPKKGFPNAMSLFTKEKMAEAPAGVSRERLRFVSTQWRALSAEDKATWVRRAAEQKASARQTTYEPCPVLHGTRNVYVRPQQSLPNAMELFIDEKKAAALSLGSSRKWMRRVRAEWNAMSSEEKEAWVQKAADLQQAILQTARRTPKPRSGYHVFLSDRLVALGRNMSLVAKEWKAAGPEVKERYNREAAEKNVSVIASEPKRRRQKGFQTVMNLFLKENMAGAPKGTPQERMRYIGAQWRSLSSEEKAAWSRKAAELRGAILQKTSAT
eukprot:TRINITY_DN4064_c0_g1_i2.p1 TRINITY_DN4064_c0_g1~~TRINITY_DN4064_c0_g1_i2.p1  ORF type:complete len:585 (-),score=28.25 TRINITY_DN4064_c0_g1_i2:76-1830(-)